jgi:hypothetical protein
MGRGTDIRAKRDRCRHRDSRLGGSARRATGSYVGIPYGQQDVERIPDAITAGVDLPPHKNDAGSLTQASCAGYDTDLLQWLIWPSVENMNAMPDWLMPVAKQNCSADDLLVDLIPWLAQLLSSALLLD